MGYMDNVVPLAMHYTDDTWRRLLKEATSTFTFKVDMLGREIEQYLTDDAYISFKYNNRQYLFNIMTITPDSGSKSIIVYCENLCLELLNEFKKPIDVTTSHTLEWYLNNNYLLVGAGMTLGINEVSDKTAKIKIESEQTGLARLASIANNFDAEFEFVTELNSDGTLKSMTVNFFKKYDGVSQGVGTYRRDLILEYGRNVDGVKRTIDKLDLYNAIEPIGKDGLNITSLVKEEYDNDGNLEYYTPAGVNRIYAPQSNNRYRAQLLNDTDGWLNRPYSADGTSNINTLYSLALNELKKHAYPAITYEITGFYDLEIGDTVRIVDTSFTPTLIVQARVAEQSICFSDPTKNKTTFGNILALENRISQDLTGRLKQLVEEAAPYRFEIVSDNGLTFKNSTGSTTLTARVYKGSNIDEVSVDSFEWLIDGVSFGGTTKSQLVSASQVTGTSVVRYNAKIGGVVVGGLEVTLQNVSDGTSPTVTINPDTSLTIVDAQGTSTTPALKGADGTSGVIVSSVAPASPENGQLWQDTSTTPQLVKKWTGNEWVIWAFYAQNLIADSLETVSAIIGKLSNTYAVDYGAGMHTGTVTIENGMKIVDDVGISRTITDFTSQSSGQGVFARYLPDKSDSTKYQQAWYTPFSLRFDDTVNDWHGQITAEALHNKGWKNVTGFVNGVQPDAAPLQYKVTINMDNTRTVKFRGGFKGNGTSNIPEAGIVQLPVEARPNSNISFPCMGSSARLARIIISVDGWIQFNIAAGSAAMNGVSMSNVFYEV